MIGGVPGERMCDLVKHGVPEVLQRQVRAADVVPGHTDPPPTIYANPHALLGPVQMKLPIFQPMRV